MRKNEHRGRTTVVCLREDEPSQLWVNMEDCRCAGADPHPVYHRAMVTQTPSASGQLLLLATVLGQWRTRKWQKSWHLLTSECSARAGGTCSKRKSTVVKPELTVLTPKYC